MLKVKILIFILFLGLLNTRSLAQELGIIVSPSVLDISIDRGKIYSKEITIKNTSNNSTGYIVTVEPLSLSDFAEISESNISPPNWIKPEISEFILDANEERKINVVFSPNRNTASGGYYGTIFIQAVGDISKFTNSKPLAVPKVGIILLVNVKGKSIKNIKFIGFNQALITTKIDSVILKFENLGNIHEMPHGKVTIQNLLNKKSINIDLTPSIIFPNSTKDLSLKITDDLNLGIYKISYDQNSEMTKTFIYLDRGAIRTFSLLTLAFILFKLYSRRYLNYRKNP